MPNNCMDRDVFSATCYAPKTLIMQDVMHPSYPISLQGTLMSNLALIIKHKTQPGKRDEVRKVWEKHMAPAVSGNPGHTSYFYCFDNSDVDSISAFQVYESTEASQEFLKTESYLAYLKEVEPLLSGPPQVTALTPVWIKGA